MPQTAACAGVCQSKKQLDKVYEQDSGTIIGNCKNIFFLQSADTDLLNYISELCGRTRICEPGEKEPLISKETLRSLKKECDFKEALFIRDDLKYFARLPDIDTYDILKLYEDDTAPGFENKCTKKLLLFSPDIYEAYCNKIIRERR